MSFCSQGARKEAIRLSDKEQGLFWWGDLYSISKDKDKDKGKDKDNDRDEDKDKFTEEGIFGVDSLHVSEGAVPPQPSEQLASCVQILMEQRAEGKRVKTPFAIRVGLVLNRARSF